MTRYQIVVPEDEEWGGPKPDGNFSGMIGLVSRREAHVAIDEITITGRINARRAIFSDK